MGHDAIAVVDFGGQYAHLIATKIRRLRVRADIRQPEDKTSAFLGYKGIILSGSPSLSSMGEDSDYNHEIFDLDIPILGICFGHQEIAKHYGGKVIHGGREWGRAKLHLIREHPLLEGLRPNEQVWMSHYDSVISVGPHFEELGSTYVEGEEEAHRFAVIGSDKFRRYGLQFHPEVDDTICGEKILANFVFRICGCKPTWTMERYLEEKVEEIRAQVGGMDVFMLVSGGVDSTVAAMMIAQAIGPKRLHLLHIDNGFMRKGESKEVLDLLQKIGVSENLHFVDAGEEFISALEGVVDPEQKRRIIGEKFVQVLEREARRLGLSKHLYAQGTIYPDTIETAGTKRADLIKTHHNRVPLIEMLIRQGRIVEPLAELYKLEVRELGEKLGIPEEVIWRHPFPGPGLAIRLLCSDSEEIACGGDGEGEQAANLAERFGLKAMVMPIKSVGVKADLRCYEKPILLSGQADWEALLAAADLILRQVPGVNRCVWNCDPSSHPRSLRRVAAFLTKERLALLREADALVMEALHRHGLYKRIWQCPTVLLPIEVEGSGRECVVVRPVLSERAMTAKPAELPIALVEEIREALLRLPGVSGVFLDITSKPPGTIEWE